MIKTGKKIIRFIFSRNFFLLLFLLTQIAFFVFTFTIANRYATKILGGTTTIIAFIVAMCINNSRLHSDTKLAYIIILVLFPIYGTLAYLLAYFGRGKRRFTRYNEQKEKIKPLKQNYDVIDSLSSNHQLGLAEHLYNNLNFPIYSNTSAKYYKSGEEMFEDMKTAMKKAKKFIFLEYFIISKGEMLNSIINILTEKAREGVEVRFMYDGTNSIARIPHSFVKKMNKLNIKCKMFMPVRAILSTEQNNRDHRKLLIIDNKITFTGGINLADEYIN
ncbi:MAG: PLDc N-terminal domain-containing protein, partial [Clostridia bacterium]|nr:PLDc N-terminal domain-containing protein [Clostridia bacterium]